MNCWVCNSYSWSPFKSGQSEEPTPSDFKITDKSYGTTGQLHKCTHCGFIQCSNIHNISQFYQALEDPDYVAGRSARARQMQTLLKILQKHKPSGTLLDIGAASDILLEEAQKVGFDPMGIEPSQYLSAQARSRNLKVLHDSFPSPLIHNSFEIITLVDVIEHLEDPKNTLKSITQHLNPGGICLITSPDVSSTPARLLGKHWWHYRLAHIGYFNKKTLTQLLETTGLKPIHISRPTWYFPIDYLVHRMFQYIPFLKNVTLPQCLNRWTIPLNLRDSLLIVAQKP